MAKVMAETSTSNGKTAPRTETLRLKAYGAHNLGLYKKVDQDRVFNQPENLMKARPELGYLYIVADGVSSGFHSEMAAELVCRQLPQLYYHKLGNKLSFENYSPLFYARTALNDAILEINRQVFEQSLLPATKDSSTTLVCALLMGKQAVIAHAGDSRAYLYRPSKNRKLPRLFKLTRDHSWGETEGLELVQAGKLTLDDLRRDKRRHWVTQVLGPQADLEYVDFSVCNPDLAQPNEADYTAETVTLRVGDWLLLCTDGLWDMAERNDLTLLESWADEALAQAEPQQAVRVLIEKACGVGGKDNIGVVAIRVDAIDQQSPEFGPLVVARVSSATNTAARTLNGTDGKHFFETELGEDEAPLFSQQTDFIETREFEGNVSAQTSPAAWVENESTRNLIPDWFSAEQNSINATPPKQIEPGVFNGQNTLPSSSAPISPPPDMLLPTPQQQLPKPREQEQTPKDDRLNQPTISNNYHQPAESYSWSRQSQTSKPPVPLPRQSSPRIPPSQPPSDTLGNKQISSGNSQSENLRRPPVNSKNSQVQSRPTRDAQDYRRGNIQNENLPPAQYEQTEKPKVNYLGWPLVIVITALIVVLVFILINNPSSQTSSPTARPVRGASPTPAINLNIAAFKNSGDAPVAIDSAFEARYTNLFNKKPTEADGNTLGHVISGAFTWQLPEGKQTATVQFFERGWLQQVQDQNVTLGAISKAYLQLLTQKKQCEFPGEGQPLDQEQINQIERSDAYKKNKWLGSRVKAFTVDSYSYVYYEHGLLKQDLDGTYSIALLGNAYAACNGWKQN